MRSKWRRGLSIITLTSRLNKNRQIQIEPPRKKRVIKTSIYKMEAVGRIPEARGSSPQLMLPTTWSVWVTHIRKGQRLVNCFSSCMNKWRKTSSCTWMRRPFQGIRARIQGKKRWQRPSNIQTHWARRRVESQNIRTEGRQQLCTEQKMTGARAASRRTPLATLQRKKGNRQRASIAKRRKTIWTSMKATSL